MSKYKHKIDYIFLYKLIEEKIFKFVNENNLNPSQIEYDISVNEYNPFLNEVSFEVDIYINNEHMFFKDVVNKYDFSLFPNDRAKEEVKREQMSLLRKIKTRSKF